MNTTDERGRFTSSLSFAGLFSGLNKKPSIILLLTPIVLVTWKYFGSKAFYLTALSSHFPIFAEPERTAELYTFVSSFILLGVLPLFIIKFVFKERLFSYGLQLGDWRFGAKTFLVIAPIFLLASYTSINKPDFLAEYPLF